MVKPLNYIFRRAIVIRCISCGDLSFWPTWICSFCLARVKLDQCVIHEDF